MKSAIRVIGILALIVLMAMACSKKNDEQAQSSEQETQTQQPADTAAAPQEEEQAAVQPQEEQAPTLSQDDTAEGTQEDAQIEDGQDDQVAAGTEEIIGTVVKTDDGVAIFSDSGNYAVAGQDLTDLVGKNVKVTGMIEEGEKPTISITSLTVIE